MEEHKKQVNIACFYVSQDRAIKEKFSTHFADLNVFYNQDMAPGNVWEEEIDEHIHKADIILLLVSSDFLASDDCRKIIMKAVECQKKRLVEIIPVILRPVNWKVNPLIGGYKSLPDDDKTVTNWGNEDEAFVNIREGVQRIIENILDRGAQEMLALEAKALFDPLQELPLFKYLVGNSGNNHIGSRRFLMKFMYQKSKNGNYSINEQEILREMHDNLYARSDVRTDLAFLEQHGNLSKTRDFKDAGNHFAEKFQIPDEFIYTASPYALEIESMIDGWRYSRTSGGSLDRLNLVTVQQSLRELTKYLSHPEDLSYDLHTIQETWDRLYKTWRQLSHDIWLYLNNLENDARKDLFDLDAFDKYKRGIFNYIDRFEQTLKEITPDICQIFAEWTDEEKERLVLYILKNHAQFGAREDERQVPSSLLRKVIYQQIADIQNWFLVQVPQFHRRASNEIQRIVGQARLLAVYLGNRIRNTTYLQELANICLECSSVEDAQQVFTLAFAHIQPLHFSQSVLPEPGIAEETDEVSPWLVPAPYKPVLRLISREKPNIQKIPVVEKSEQKKAQRDLQQSGLQEIADEWNMFKDLFTSLPLDLGSLIGITIETTLCMLLEQIVDTCLKDLNGHYSARDGSKIVLCNPQEQTYIHLRAPNGILYLPRYIFDQLIDR